MLLTVFFHIHVPLFGEFQKHRGTIISNMHYETLQSLRRSIKNKRQELLKESVVLLLDNARPSETSKLKWDQLDHLPYNSDVSPLDFHVFGLLKKYLKRQSFNSNDELLDAVKD